AAQGLWVAGGVGAGRDLGAVANGKPLRRRAAGCARSEIARDGLNVMAQPLLEVQNLNVAFDTERGQIRPVRDVSFTIFPGQTVALVGESGCGKSVTSLSILRLIPQPPGKILGGQVLLNGRSLLDLSEKEMRRVRGAEIAMIFQEPM